MTNLHWLAWPHFCRETRSDSPAAVDHPLLVHPSAARQFTGNDQAHDLFIDPLAQSFFYVAFRVGTSQQSTYTTSLIYLVSGAGDAAENARSNVARSALGKSETAT